MAGHVGGRSTLHRLLDVVAEREHPVDVVGERRIDAARLLQVLADHVEDVDLVHERGLVVVLPYRVHDLLQTVAVTGEVLGVHRLRLDERHHGAHLGLETVEHRRRDAGGGGRERVLVLDLAVDEQVAPLPRDAHDVLAAPRQVRPAGHGEDVVVVGDAAPQRLEPARRDPPSQGCARSPPPASDARARHLVHPFVVSEEPSLRPPRIEVPRAGSASPARDRCRRRPGPRRSGRAGR